MKRAFIFSQVGIVVQSVYCSRPDRGDEHGVRLEFRLLDGAPHRGSRAAAQGLSLNETVWRADVFTSVPKPPRHFDRAHFHPFFNGHEPSDRQWDELLTTDPYEWLIGQLSDLDALLFRAKRSLTGVKSADSEALRRAIPEINELVACIWKDIESGVLTPMNFDIHIRI